VHTAKKLKQNILGLFKQQDINCVQYQKKYKKQETSLVSFELFFLLMTTLDYALQD
jgi:hypothetical protein